MSNTIAQRSIATNEAISPTKTPLANAVSQHRKSLLATALMLPVAAMAQGPQLEEVVVTAQKRTSNLQDTPISVQVLGNERMSQLNISNFEDYIKFLPTVSYSPGQPGQALIFMRGITSGNNGNHSASMPSVGVYLDEQPITTINEVLDIHAYDIARIETLAGPQGTLFGSSSQSGTLRIITNKPNLGEFEAGYNVAVDTIDGGDNGYTGEGFINLPIGDNTALRLVGWHDKQGGYIDNVFDSINYAASGIVKTNEGLVKDDWNEVETSGLRAQLKIELNDNWTVTPAITYQERETEGVWDHDPDDLGDLESRAFFDSFSDEDWYQAGLTVRGQIGDFELVYAGAYLDRDKTSQYDYTGYAEYLEDLYAYYGYACYLYSADGSCADPSQLVTGDENWNRTSHELRLQSSQDQRLRFIVGLFYQDQEHDFDLQWIPPDMDPAGSIIPGGHTVWQTKQVREDSDKAIFGEVSYDFNDQFTLLVGARYYEYENELYGFNGFIGHCTGFYDASGEFVEDRANGVPQYPCFDTMILDDTKKNEDVIYKVNLTYEMNDDVMMYVTYSEGYRPGGVNRARVDGVPGYEEDFTNNYEFGWKSSWMDDRLRFNGAAYYVEWDDFQYSILDFAVSNLTIINNAGQATVKGLEFDLDFAATQELTLSLAVSLNDAELDEDLINGTDLEAPDGSALPFVPETQFSAIGRYDTELAGYNAYAQAAWSYTGSSWNDLRIDNRIRQSSYDLVNLAFGISKDNWTLDLFVDNATDERTELSRNDPGYPSDIDTTINTNRPRTYGIRFGQRF
ncbi:MAG: TonB-dependent receptor [Halieaceae bacterium]|jgi:iron complex outermembrane recepter protein|nr:TonB-dependent receptor [Halieaceae bacterium]